MPAERPKLTPMMQRYQEVKRETPGTLLLFRMGDFYELFYEDAEIAAKTLGLTLTSRDKNSANPVPMAGFPYHALDGYLQKLIRAGHKAAICDQVEDPKAAKGLVRREVTRIVTPGTLTDDGLLDPRQSNYLAVVVPGRTRWDWPGWKCRRGGSCVWRSRAEVQVTRGWRFTAEQVVVDRRDRAPAITRST